MAGKKLVNKIVEGIEANSPIRVTEAFAELMHNLVERKVIQIRESVAAGLMKEEESDMEGAIDFVLEFIEEGGVDIISEAVEIASVEFNVSAEKLQEALANEFIRPDEYEPTPAALNMILTFGSILEHNEDVRVDFSDESYRMVSEMEARKMLSTWMVLNNENRKMMEETMVKDLFGFERVLSFCIKEQNNG